MSRTKQIRQIFLDGVANVVAGNTVDVQGQQYTYVTSIGNNLQATVDLLKTVGNESDYPAHAVHLPNTQIREGGANAKLLMPVYVQGCMLFTTGDPVAEGLDIVEDIKNAIFLDAFKNVPGVTRVEPGPVPFSQVGTPAADKHYIAAQVLYTVLFNDIFPDTRYT